MTALLYSDVFWALLAIGSLALLIISIVVWIAQEWRGKRDIC